MAKVYQPSTSGRMALTVVAPSVTPPTLLVPTNLVLQFVDANGTPVIAPKVKPGTVWMAKAILTEEVGKLPLPGMAVTFTVEFVTGPDVVQVVTPTDALGVAVYDLTPLIAATETNKGYGEWSVSASFLGQTI